MDAGRVEIGCFQQYRAGTLGDLAVGAAHDAGHGHGSLLVGDNQHVVGELSLTPSRLMITSPSVARRTMIFLPLSLS